MADTPIKRWPAAVTFVKKDAPAPTPQPPATRTPNPAPQGPVPEIQGGGGDKKPY